MSKLNEVWSGHEYAPARDNGHFPAPLKAVATLDTTAIGKVALTLGAIVVLGVLFLVGGIAKLFESNKQAPNEA